MPAESPCWDRLPELRRKLDRLASLPVRAVTVRAVLTALSEECPSELESAPDAADPGWALRLMVSGQADPLSIVESGSWWPTTPAGSATEAVQRLWRYSVAVSCAARRLGQEAGDPQPEHLARVGLLLPLGYWALAAVDPARLASVLAIGDLNQRREAERACLGADAAWLGKLLAESWGLDGLLEDATWIVGETGRELLTAGRDPRRLAILQRAWAWAERTPWALGRSDCGHREADPWLHLLIAEVQTRCAGSLSEPFHSHEERLARSHARTLKEVARLRTEQAASRAVLDALAASSPTDTPAAWAERASAAWAQIPGVDRARVAWQSETDATRNRPHLAAVPDAIFALTVRDTEIAQIQVWSQAEPRIAATLLDTLPAWSAWAGLVAERARLAGQLEAAVGVHRKAAERDDGQRLFERLEALAEFAAGAGHELNNPLAVIVGRAQLLASKLDDPDAQRSLRAILTQAQRAHRILRDLMYIARPPDPRPRPCQPEEIVRSCLRDLSAEAEARGVRVVAEIAPASGPAWVDPEPVRHLTEAFVRNAMEGTPPGGTVRVDVAADSEALRWTIADTGKGLSPTEAEHLFDPFFCGRQAGRGLGLGLPRVGRFLAQNGGQVRWRAAPGRGASFQIRLPLSRAPSDAHRPS